MRKTDTLWIKNIHPCHEHGGKSLDNAAGECPLCALRMARQKILDLTMERDELEVLLREARGESIGPRA